MVSLGKSIALQLLDDLFDRLLHNPLTVEKLQLWVAVDSALHAAYPDHARVIRSALEDRLEPGPWSLGFVRSEKRPSLARDRWTHDRLLAETGRALSAAHGSAGDEYHQALERWLAESVVVLFRSSLGLAEIYAPGWLAPRFVAWAAHALEAGENAPAVRALASMPPDSYAATALEDIIAQVIRELRIERVASVEFGGAARATAREILHGRASPGRGASDLHSLAVRGATGMDRQQWSELAHRLALGTEDPDTVRAVLETAREVLLVQSGK